ncbi:MAG: fibronectin type III domain-containing protein [Chitinophagales bacterium]|nr:fibronectin type III domain-containing protein [Chitinophagales bacterium]
MISRPILGFKEKSPSELASYGQNVVNLMSTYPAFATTPVPYSEVQLAINRLLTAIADALNGGHLRVMEKKLRVAELESYLRTLAAFVQVVAKGNAEMISEAGFEATEHYGPVGPLGQVEGMEISYLPGRSGELEINFKKLKGAGSYNIQVLDNSNQQAPEWRTVLSTLKSHTVLSGLTPGVTYQIRTVGVGADGEGAASPAISIMAI